MEIVFKRINQKIINASKTTVELSDKKIIRKSDIALTKSSSSTTRSFSGNISFPLLPNPGFKVGFKKTIKSKSQPMRKTGPKTRLQTELANSDSNTRTRMANPSIKRAKSRSTRNKVQTSNAGYLAGDESIKVRSETSDISDWEWIAGSFPCRDKIRGRIISDNFSQQEPCTPCLDSQITQGNIKLKF